MRRFEDDQPATSTSPSPTPTARDEPVVQTESDHTAWYRFNKRSGDKKKNQDKEKAEEVDYVEEVDGVWGKATEGGPNYQNVGW